ncbi:MAG: PqqD family peptide modification chaperone [Thermoproteota archaeon]
MKTKTLFFSNFLNFRKEFSLFDNNLIVASGKDLNGQIWFFNETAYEILKLCDGNKNLKEITELICSSYEGNKNEIVSDIRNFIINGVKSGYILLNHIDKENLNDLLCSCNVNLPSQPLRGYLYSPLLVLLEVTYACNLRCKHCYASAGRPMKDELSADELKKLAEELGKIKVFDVAIGGGEPLLREDLPEVIYAFVKNKVEPTLATNGTLFDEEIAEELWKAGLRKVQFSLDGASPDVHDSIRGVKGSFEKTIKAVEVAKTIGYSVAIKTIAQKENLNQLQGITKLAYNLAVDGININRAVPYGRAKENLFETFIPYKMYEESVRDLKRTNKVNLKLDLYPSSKRISDRKEFATCQAATMSLHVCPNGDVKPCSYFPDQYICGNIRKESVQDIWLNSKVLNELRNIRFNELWEPCKSCSIVCNGGCRAAAVSFFGDFYAPDPLCPLVQNKIQSLLKLKKLEELKAVQKICASNPEEYLSIKMA